MNLGALPCGIRSSSKSRSDSGTDRTSSPPDLRICKGSGSFSQHREQRACTDHQHNHARAPGPGFHPQLGAQPIGDVFGFREAQAGLFSDQLDRWYEFVFANQSSDLLFVVARGWLGRFGRVGGVGGFNVDVGCGGGVDAAAAELGFNYLALVVGKGLPGGVRWHGEVLA